MVADLSRRYKGITPEALENILNPLLLPISRIDRTIFKLPNQSHYRATFEIDITPANETILQVGRTGKFIDSGFLSHGQWEEIAKGRIIEVDFIRNVAVGEIYLGTSDLGLLKEQVDRLSVHDLLEIDQYGASAKILSALSEYYLVQHGKARGYRVIRMPEDMAKHLGAYPNFDFIFEKNRIERSIEVKSLWGTNTQRARLIHSKTTKPKDPEESWTETQIKNYYPTSSCKFTTQDFFAVNLFLRTGNIFDFAFAKSVSVAEDPIHGLPYVPSHPNHVSQNPVCIIDNQRWFADINDVWDI